EKCESIPFLDESIWSYCDPEGPVGVVLDVAQPPQGAGPAKVRTIVTLEKTRVRMPNLELVSEEATGRGTIRDNIVGLDDVHGRIGGGQTTVTGTLDFAHQPIRYQLELRLDGLDLSALPASWQIDRTGIRGRMSSLGDLRITVTPLGLDLTGSSGSGRI